MTSPLASELQAETCRALSFSRSVNKDYSHKWALDEVFITDFLETTDKRMRIGIELPRAHGFYCEHLQRDRPDPLILVEACRQSCFVIAHEQFGVPLTGSTNQFLFQELEISFSNISFPPRNRPIDIEISGYVRNVRHRGNVPSALDWEFTTTHEGQLLSNCKIRMIWIERKRWAEIRAGIRKSRGLPAAMVPYPLPDELIRPESVGRYNPENVVLSKVSRERDDWLASTRIDVRHPVLFDHSIDHIYAMVQLEIARQLAVYAVAESTGASPAKLYPQSIGATFSTVGDLDVPTTARARVLAPGSVSGRTYAIELTQGARQISTQRWNYGTT